jgi:hypothetical protein
MSRGVRIATLAAGMLAAISCPALADDDDYSAEPLVPVLAQMRVSLAQGLKANEAHGWPVSGKYEIDKGALRLSVYTARDDQISEVIVDYTSGAVITAAPIREPEDLADARRHAQAMAAAKLILVKVVEEAETTSSGYRAVRVVPILVAGVAPVAVITLMKGDDIKEISEKLD